MTHTVALPYDLVIQLCEYFDDRADVVDGDYGQPRPNRAMQFQRDLEEALSRAAGPSTNTGDVPSASALPGGAGSGADGPVAVDGASAESEGGLSMVAEPSLSAERIAVAHLMYAGALLLDRRNPQTRAGFREAIAAACVTFAFDAPPVVLVRPAKLPEVSTEEV